MQATRFQIIKEGRVDQEKLGELIMAMINSGNDLELGCEYLRQLEESGLADLLLPKIKSIRQVLDDRFGTYWKARAMLKLAASEHAPAKAAAVAWRFMKKEFFTLYRCCEGDDGIPALDHIAEAFRNLVLRDEWTLKTVREEIQHHTDGLRMDPQRGSLCRSGPDWWHSPWGWDPLFWSLIWLNEHSLQMIEDFIHRCKTNTFMLLHVVSRLDSSDWEDENDFRSLFYICQGLGVAEHSLQGQEIGLKVCRLFDTEPGRRFLIDRLETAFKPPHPQTYHYATLLAAHLPRPKESDDLQNTIARLIHCERISVSSRRLAEFAFQRRALLLKYGDSFFSSSQ